MKNNFWKNQFWIVTGLETLVFGIVMLFGKKLDEHVFPPFDRADSQSFAWFLTLIGGTVVVLFLSRLKRYKVKVAFIAILTFIWMYLAVNFFLTAVDPDYPISTHPLILAILSFGIVVRILLHSYLESPERLEGGD